MPTSQAKKNNAKQLYVIGRLTDEEIAEKLQIQERTLRRWIIEGKWRRGGENVSLEDVESFASRALSETNIKKRQSLLEMVIPVLELAISNLNRKLLEEKESGQLSGLRDYANLVGKLMEIKGKITGETTGSTEDQGSIRNQVLSEFRQFIKHIEVTNIKQIEGYSDKVDLDQFKVQVIE